MLDFSMAKTGKSTPTQRSAHAAYVLGSKAYARISAVEGLSLSRDAEKMFRGFDARKISATARLVTIITHHSPPSAVHVVPHGGGWATKRGGNDRATRVFDTQREAVEYGRSQARTRSGDLVMHGPDGRIRERRSYGADPQPRQSQAPIKR